MNHDEALCNALQPLSLSFHLFRGEEELQANVDLNNACARADDVDWVDTMEAARNWLTNYENGDPRTDMMMVEAADGALVAKGLTWWWKNDQGEWHYAVNGWVHPQWRRKGVGRAVNRWVENRAQQIAATHKRNGAPAYLTTGTEDHVVGKVALLMSEGYSPVRHGFTMLRNLSEPVPDMPLPDGIEVRPVQQAHIRQIWEAFREAFRDHWGYSEWTEHDYQSFISWPDLEPGLWRVAWQGDEVVGGCINAIPHKQNEALGIKRGWLEQIAIRRPWRKQGVAKATIAGSLRMFKEMGITEAGLGVDAQNPTGALQLYQGMGFRVYKSGTNYRKPLTTSA